jgi:hypothetical protein
MLSAGQRSEKKERAKSAGEEEGRERVEAEGGKDVDGREVKLSWKWRKWRDEWGRGRKRGLQATCVVVCGREEEGARIP